MPPDLENPEPVSHGTHVRWDRTEESSGFFIDEDRLLRWFFLLAAVGIGLVALLAGGLWRLQRAALAPPVFVGISHGLIFSGQSRTLAEVGEADFDRQLSDTVEVLFTRTEKGLPPAIGDFCSAEVVAAASQSYQESASRYPAGFVQTLAILDARTIAARQGFRRMHYRGSLSSRSVSAAQTSPVYLDCTFVIGAPTPMNATGWRLVRLDALGREDYYRSDREQALRRALNPAPAP